MTSPGILPAALSKLFGLDLADAAEARDWLADGGWAVLDRWIEAHRGDVDGEAGPRHDYAV